MILKGARVAAKVIGGLDKKLPPPRKLVVLRSSDPASVLYVSKKEELARALKVLFEAVLLGDNLSEDDLIAAITKLNSDPTVGGIVVQMPLPARLDRERIARSIDPSKDIDGFHYILGGGGEKRGELFIPPTVLAIDEVLNFYRIKKDNAKILVVGGGFLVGRPLSRFWRDAGLDAELLERGDRDYESKLQKADIIVVATGGGRRFSQADFKDGAVVIDASTVSDGQKIRGDVAATGWPADKTLVAVPGGVGPVTVAMLFKNFFQAAS